MDYSASPLQPIASALVSIAVAPGGAVSFTDVSGFSAVARDPATGGQGGFILALDPGLPGNVAIDPDLARMIVQPRAAGVPPLSGIAEISVAWLSDTTVEIVLANAAGVPTDPSGLAFEVALWRGLP